MDSCAGSSPLVSVSSSGSRRSELYGGAKGTGLFSVSVSSGGSRRWERPQPPYLHKITGFQYPQADRDGRNHSNGGLCPRGVWVSVSSSGSRRSEPKSWPSRRAQRVMFQYPQADRDGRNIAPPSPSPPHPPFQYPQADRDGRNSKTGWVDFYRQTRFSILKRIERGFDRKLYGYARLVPLL